MWIEVLLFLAILCLLAYLDTNKPKNYPPGPKWLPIVGTLVELAKRKQKSKYLYKVISDLAVEYKSRIVGLKFGKTLVVVVLGYDQIIECLSSDDLIGRPQGPFYKVRTWDRRLGVLLTDSNFWKEQRKFILRHLRDFGFGKRDMSTMLEEEAEVIGEYIKNNINPKSGFATLDASNLFNVHVLNTLWAMITGERYGPGESDLNKLQKSINKLLANSHMVGALFDHFPVLRYIAPEFSGYNLYVNAHKPVWEFLRDEIQKHKKTFNPAIERDFIDVYLKMLQSPDKPESFSEDQLLAICLDLFVAGSETTNNSLTFGFLYFLLYPDVQKKVQEEIDRVIGRDRVPSLNDRPNMPYTEAAVMESVRMFIGRGHGIPHRAVKDTYLNGYFIPKDTTVVMNYHDVMMGKEFPDDDPESFRPERYIKDGNLFVPNYFMPFGFGKRRCMGESLAKATIFIFISCLLQKFNFSIPPGCTPELEWFDGVTPGVKPFNLNISLRKLS